MTPVINTQEQPIEADSNVSLNTGEYAITFSSKNCLFLQYLLKLF